MDAQTMEAKVVYGDDGADVRGGGLDIEGIDEDGSNRHGGGGHAHGAHHGGGGSLKDDAKQRVAAVTGGGSSDVKLGGDRYGVGVMGRNKAVQRGSTTGSSGGGGGGGVSRSRSSGSGGGGGGGGSMIRGHGGADDVVQVGHAFKTNGGRSKYVYQTGFDFASLSGGRVLHFG